MQIHISTKPARRRPQAGDTYTSKTYGPQVRIPVRVTHGPYAGAFVVSNGRQRYEWVSPDYACANGWAHLVPLEWRPETATRGAA